MWNPCDTRDIHTLWSGGRVMLFWQLLPFAYYSRMEQSNCVKCQFAKDTTIKQLWLNLLFSSYTVHPSNYILMSARHLSIKLHLNVSPSPFHLNSRKRITKTKKKLNFQFQKTLTFKTHMPRNSASFYIVSTFILTRSYLFTFFARCACGFSEQVCCGGC